ncbi:MAG: glycosyltransferase family 4 protein, partial [Paraglaciecola sp.]|nr:glycosyltransferase family 4 protein [Paraglaciecola sp.]
QRGMPLYVYMLCKYLPLALPDIKFYFFINTAFEHNEAEENYRNRLVDVATAQNVKIVNAESEGEIVWEQKILPRLLKTYQIDLLHMPANRVCLTTSVSQIVTFHDAMEWTQLDFSNAFTRQRSLKENFYSLRMSTYRWLVYFWGMRKANKILSISQYAVDSIVDSFPNTKNKISYTYHGIPKGYERKEHNIDINVRKGVLMLGGDSLQKNPVNAILAWSKLPEDIQNQHPLTIAGFAGNRDSLISKTIKQLNLGDKVTIKGWITNEELIELFKGARAFLFVSSEEGFGFPLLQSMSIGTPVVTSTATVLKEIGQDAVLTAAANNADEIMAQLQRLLTNDALWAEQQAKGWARAQDFNWQQAAESIAAIYLATLQTHQTL